MTEQPTIKTKMTILKADGTSEERVIDLVKDPGLKRLHELLDPIFYEQRGRPCYFEHVSCLSEDDMPIDMFVDETGALRGELLTANLAATKIYYRLSIKRGAPHRNGILTEPGAALIHGTAVVFDRRVWF